MGLFNRLKKEKRLVPAKDIRNSIQQKRLVEEQNEFNDIIHFVNQGIQEVADFGYSFFTLVEDVDVSTYYFSQLEKELKINGYSVAYDDYRLSYSEKAFHSDKTPVNKKIMIIRW